MAPAPPSPRREAGSRPFPDKPIGTPNDELPFDHIVVVMMENHSFDNLLGGLSRQRGDVDGLSFDSAGTATNSNPGAPGMEAEVGAYARTDTSQGKGVGQSWKATHRQINNGAMDGFVAAAGSKEPMGYYPREVLPFAYSLASTFTLANRWFSSMPGPTYPNRRFLLAGTAFGGTTTGLDTLLDSPPPNGALFSLLSDHHISWTNYFSDVPMTAVIPSIALKHLDHYHSLDRFFHDCKSGSLPAVSLVDPALGPISAVMHMHSLPSIVKDALKLIGAHLPPAETEENPQSMY